jgi:[ribosomal protein S5]-alanine N-acetyltransferase
MAARPRPTIALVPILADGATAVPIADLAAVPADVVPSTLGLYADRGYQPPFVGYLAVEAGRAVGTCAFVAPPRGGRVEIAYFTFAGGEGRGVATEMARRLVALARAARPDITVFAHTRPAPGASAAILARLGFGCAGVVEHPEDGPVWEWRLPPPPAGLPAGPPSL